MSITEQLLETHCTPEDLVLAMLHDSTEAYFSDIASPFKAEMTNYRELEGRIWQRIAHRFNVAPVLPKVIKQADTIALLVEAMSLNPRMRPHEWIMWEENGEFAEAWIENVGPISSDMPHPQVIKETYLNVFDKLYDEFAEVRRTRSHPAPHPAVVGAVNPTDGGGV
jgi:hypothetical protein